MELENLIEHFLYAYFYHIEGALDKVKNKLAAVKYQSEEANTDEFQKKFIKEFILENNSLKECKLNELSLKKNGVIDKVKISSLSDIYIKNVYLPEELTPEFKKNIVANKKGVYSNPDLYLEISNGFETVYRTVELKSTKNDKIPGSSVQQISLYEWVIFIRRKNNNVSVATGQYINSITEKLAFPDRSPRPEVGFKRLSGWNEKNRILENDELIFNIDTTVEDNVKHLVLDWQEVLVDEWFELIISGSKLKSEKWFNNVIRKFSYKLISYINNLPQDELENLRSILSKNIEDSNNLD